MRREDFERLYERHAAPLLRFLHYRTGDLQLAEDVLADTFERVLTARRPFDRRKASEKTWLYTIALNLVRDHARRAAMTRRTLERAHAVVEVSAGAGELALVEDRDALQRALTSLTPEEREAVALRYGADLTVPEVAKVTHETLTTAKGRIYRALRKLKQELEPSPPY